jgi:essential nuclear protein 1
MGRARKRMLDKAGGKVDKPNAPIDVQMRDAKLAKPKRLEIHEIDQQDAASDMPIKPERLTKVLRVAQKQAENAGSDDSADDEPAMKKGKAISLTNLNEGESEFEDEDEEDVEYDPNDVVVDKDIERDLEKFLEPGEGGTIYDLIRQKLIEKNNPNLIELGSGRDNNVPPEAIRLYNEVGSILSRYRTGKIPIAFKNLGTLNNWEQLIEYTHPEQWTAAAMLYATKMFVSNQKPHRCQRFLNSILLPRLRDEIAAHKRLSTHLYECVFKSCFRPSAFYKGIVLPLAESGSCTLTESVIIGSVILKRHIPAIHSCAALFRLASMKTNNFASGLYFMQALLRKKYALPYQVVDKLVEFFTQTASTNDELPILWHRTFQLFVESYANDLSGGQIELLQLVIKEKQHHYAISPTIIGRLKEVQERIEKDGDIRME